ncbi:hypothetical protein GCM10007392_00620 [Saccharospirillum salsuginis]|uniref:Uncharacterized protein n=2 Tax=Saccharospirillum salsuginis TaxID=418750 RepID=A0A918JZV7_9GAMM|nr:hypothetical protein GCM10007392_00620 [Saccharospirillum salsuginis]
MGASTTTVIAILAVGLISLMVVGMLIMQTRHRNLAVTRDKLLKLNNQYRKLNNVLRNLPTSYLSPEMRDFLYQALLFNLKSQMELNPDQRKYLDSDYKQLERERAQVRKHPPKPEPPSQINAEETNLHRQTLKSFYAYIKRNYEAGHLNKTNAEKMLMQVELKLVETALEYFKFRARNALKRHYYKEARVAYQKAIDTIGASRHSEQFKQEEIQLRNQLNKTVEEWRNYREQQSAGQAEKLAEEMEDLIEDQESWKKKNVYD